MIPSDMQPPPANPALKIVRSDTHEGAAFGKNGVGVLFNSDYGLHQLGRACKNAWYGEAEHNFTDDGRNWWLEFVDYGRWKLWTFHEGPGHAVHELLLNPDDLHKLAWELAGLSCE